MLEFLLGFIVGFVFHYAQNQDKRFVNNVGIGVNQKRKRNNVGYI